jgi:hypothetical protein
MFSNRLLGKQRKNFMQAGNLGEILAAIRNAQAPERFTHKFLSDLGFRSTNDRPIIGMLKALARSTSPNWATYPRLSKAIGLISKTFFEILNGFDISSKQSNDQGT